MAPPSSQSGVASEGVGGRRPGRGLAKRLAVRLLFELGPLIVFFAFARWQGIFWATAAFMAATGLAAALSWRRERRLPLVPLVSTAYAVVFGGLTLLLDAPEFIMVRPTLFNLGIAAALAVTLARGRLLLRTVFGAGFDMPHACWRLLSWRLVAFLIALAVLNELVWRLFSTDVWVGFKSFGIPLLDSAFIAAQWPFLRRNGTVQED